MAAKRYLALVNALKLIEANSTSKREVVFVSQRRGSGWAQSSYWS